MAEARGMVIVGAGECGARAAFALREEGYAGPVTLIGEERHLPYERPPLSKNGLIEGGGPRTIADAERFRGADITLRLATRVSGIDRVARTVSLGDGSSIPYDRLLLATGARPRRLAMAEGLAHCLTLRTHDDAEVIACRLAPGSRVAIVGGGFIGLEIAAAAASRGCSVHVVEALPRLLARAVPAGIAEAVAAAHARHGVELLCGRALTSIREHGDGVTLALDTGETIEAHLVIIGIGAVPNTEIAEAAGLAIENGIRVDERLSTSDPAILAAGDCCSFPLSIYGGRRVRLESWRNAQEQGAFAARMMLGRGDTPPSVPWFWSDQYDLGLQVAGLVDEGTATVRRELGEGAFILFHLAPDGRLVAASGIGPGNAVARDIRLAEMMIARRVRPDPALLAAPQTKLKSLLAA